jgi:hypothetical protein
VELTEREMIGGLLRFAPGRLGARQDRAPVGCGIGRWVVSWLPCVAPRDKLDSRARTNRAGRCCLAGMATGSALWRGALRAGWSGLLALRPTGDVGAGLRG